MVPSSTSFIFLTLFFCSTLYFVDAKSKDPPPIVSDLVTKSCLMTAPLNKTATDVCDAFNACCEIKCPKRKDGIKFKISLCYENDGKLSNDSSCTCEIDAGVAHIFAKLGLAFKIILLCMFLSIVACIGCCVYCCCFRK